jgi:uncharacterized membrane protein
MSSVGKEVDYYPTTPSPQPFTIQLVVPCTAEEYTSSSEMSVIELVYPALLLLLLLLVVVVLLVG